MSKTKSAGEADRLYKLDLHDQVIVGDAEKDPTYYKVIRVPGGWIYTLMQNIEEEHYLQGKLTLEKTLRPFAINSTFVPFNLDMRTKHITQFTENYLGESVPNTNDPSNDPTQVITSIITGEDEDGIPMNTQGNRMLTISMVAQKVGVSENRVYQFIKNANLRQKLLAEKYGGKLWCHPIIVDMMIDRKGAKGGEPIPDYNIRGAVFGEKKN